jgi:hypothetical protein
MFHPSAPLSEYARLHWIAERRRWRLQAIFAALALGAALLLERIGRSFFWWG